MDDIANRGTLNADAIFESSPDCLIIIDTEGLIQFTNKNLELLTGYSEQELRGKSVDSLVPAAHRRSHAAHRAHYIAQPTTRFMGTSDILSILTKDGVEIAVDIGLSQVSMHGDMFIIASVRDMRVKRKEQQQKEEFEAQLQQIQKMESLGILAGGIAHDFNNLLTSILGHSSLILKQLPADSISMNSASEIQRISETAADLVRQLLAYSGKGHFIKQPVNLSLQVEDMATLLQTIISKKAVIRYDFFPELPNIMGDATQIRQIVMNLITNASDAIGDRSGIITLRTGMLHVDHSYMKSLTLYQDLPEGNYAYIEVCDTGTGMDSETQAKIFDPFFTTKVSGRGLGLAAVQGIMRGHHGFIKIYSELSSGTTFKLLFPCFDNMTMIQDSTPDEEQAEEMNYKHSGTILVVDDEESIRGFLASALNHLGYDVKEAADGREALAVYAEHGQDIKLVLLDLTMPHMGGEETFGELRRMKSDLPVVLMSGYTEDEVTSLFAGKGITGFLQKPFSLDSLTRTLTDCVV